MISQNARQYLMPYEPLPPPPALKVMTAGGRLIAARLIAILIPILIIVHSVRAVSNQDVITILVVTSKRANVRQGPSTRWEVVKVAEEGDEALQLEQGGDWYKAQFADGTIGWIYHTLITKKQEIRPQPQVPFTSAHLARGTTDTIKTEEQPDGATAKINEEKRFDTTPGTMMTVPPRNSSVRLGTDDSEAKEVKIPKSEGEESRVTVGLSNTVGSPAPLKSTRYWSEQNKQTILFILSLLLLFVFVIAVVIAYIRKIKRATYSLQRLKEELTRADALLQEALERT